MEEREEKEDKKEEKDQETKDQEEKDQEEKDQEEKNQEKKDKKSKDQEEKYSIEKVQEKKNKALVVSKKNNIMPIFKLRNKFIFIVVSILVAAIVLNLIFVGFRKKRENEINISAKSSLEKLVDTNQLRTVKFTYNAVAKKCKKKDCSKNPEKLSNYSYFVKYNGEVTAGINFADVIIKADSRNKNLYITIPDAYLSSYQVDIESLDFIFRNKGEDEATRLPEIMKLCTDDLKEKADKNDLILKTAKENAIIVLNNFFEQRVKVLDEDYKVIIK